MLYQRNFFYFKLKKRIPESGIRIFAISISMFFLFKWNSILPLTVATRVSVTCIKSRYVCIVQCAPRVQVQMHVQVQVLVHVFYFKLGIMSFVAIILWKVSHALSLPPSPSSLHFTAEHVLASSCRVWKSDYGNESCPGPKAKRYRWTNQFANRPTDRQSWLNSRAHATENNSAAWKEFVASTTRIKKKTHF